MAQTSYGTITITDTTDIESIVVEYAQNQDPLTAPINGWGTTRPEWAEGYYIWQRTRTHKYGTSSSADDIGVAVCITGSQGETGRSLTSTTTQYTTAASSATITTDNMGDYIWYTNIPSYNNSTPVYWVRVTNIYSNPSTGYLDVYSGEVVDGSGSSNGSNSSSQNNSENNITTVYIIYKDEGLTSAVSMSQTALTQSSSNINTIIRLWYRSNSATAPSKPTSHITQSGNNVDNTWTTTKPIDKDGYRYYYYCDELCTGGGVYKWTDVVLDTSNLSQYEIGALTTKVKNFWWDTDGAHVASGKNGSEVTTESSSTYGYNSLMGLTGISFGYDDMKVVDLTTTSPALSFYLPPVFNNNVASQGNKVMQLSNNALTFYNPSDGTTAYATLNVSGLKLVKGGIEAGTFNNQSSSNRFIYLSTEDYGNSITINGHSDSNWRAIIGTKFGVDNEGNLYASNANISGVITVSSGSDLSAGLGNYTTKANAVKRSQVIYYRTNNTITTWTMPTSWVGTSSNYNTWTTQVPILDSSNTYCYLYTTTQIELNDGSFAYNPTIPQLDNTTTVINGGNIITGSITANEITGNKLSAIYADMGNITAGNITKGNNSINFDNSPATLEFKNASTWSAATQGIKYDSNGLAIKGAITATSLTLGSDVQIPASTAISGLSTVATTGSYNDLSNKPTIPDLTNYITEINQNGITIHPSVLTTNSYYTLLDGNGLKINKILGSGINVNNDTAVATFGGNGISFDSDTPFSIGDTSASITFDGDGHIYINGAGVLFGSQAVSNVLDSADIGNDNILRWTESMNGWWTTPIEIVEVINPTGNPYSQRYYEKDKYNYTISEDEQVNVGKIYYNILATEVDNPSGNPYDNEYYEKDDINNYFISGDKTIDIDKTYYTLTVTEISTPSGNPVEQNYYEKSEDNYSVSDDTVVNPNKTYYTINIVIDNMVSLMAASDYSSGIATYKYNIDLYDGITPYTLSFYYRSTSDCDLNIFICATDDEVGSDNFLRTKYKSLGYITLPNTNDEWRRYIVFRGLTIGLSDLDEGSGQTNSGFIQFFAKKNPEVSENIWVEIQHIQLERGNIVTEWAAATDDTYDSMTDSINKNIIHVEENLSDIIGGVSNTLTQEIGSLSEEIDKKVDIGDSNIANLYNNMKFDPVAGLQIFKEENDWNVTITNNGILLALKGTSVASMQQYNDTAESLMKANNALISMLRLRSSENNGCLGIVANSNGHITMKEI